MKSRSKAVQFDTAESVLQAYRNKGVANWAIFCDPQFFERYQDGSLDAGYKMLEQYLQLLSRSAAIYTLCVYETVPVGGIKETTQCDGSFNFQLRERPMNSLPSEVHRMYQGNAMQLWDDYRELQQENKVLAIENAKLKKDNDLLEDDLQALENQPPQSMWGQFLNDPNVKEGVGVLIGEIVDWVRNPKGAAGGGSFSVGAVPESEALNALLRKVPDLYDLFDKLNRLSEIKPGKFDFYISALRKMRV